VGESGLQSAKIVSAASFDSGLVHCCKAIPSGLKSWTLKTFTIEGLN